MNFQDFTDFSIFSQIAGRRKFFSTEPIPKILDVLKSSRSESSISAIFEAQDQIMLPPDTGPLGDFSKNRIHSPTIRSTPEPFSIKHWGPVLLVFEEVRS